MYMKLEVPSKLGSGINFTQGDTLDNILLLEMRQRVVLQSILIPQNLKLTTNNNTSEYTTNQNKPVLFRQCKSELATRLNCLNKKEYKQQQ